MPTRPSDQVPSIAGEPSPRPAIGSPDREDDGAWVEREVEEMAAAWRRGERPTAGEILSRHPEVGDEAAIRLIFEEVSLRRDSGWEVATAEVVSRFPRWQARLQVLLSCDRLMRPPAVVIFPEVGDRLGDFQLLAELGRGTSGRTFLASQPSLADRPVVLKVLPRDHDEHLSLARLQHTHIVPLYSEQVFPERSLRGLCMPFLGGASLAQILDAMADLPADRRRGRHLLDALDRLQATHANLAPAAGPFRQQLEQASYIQAICWIGVCLAEALQYAHGHGLVHMDVKPSNVLIAGDGQPMLLDFHLARGPIVPGDGRPDRLGGTPGRMSPEQRSAMRAIVAGRDLTDAVDGRSDLYSLGLLFYEALGGPQDLVDGSPRQPLDRANPRVSAGLADVVHRCLADDPRDRYRDAAALGDDLLRHLNDLPLRGVANRSPSERFRKWKRRHPYALARGLAWFSTLAAAVVVAVLAGAYYHQRVGEIEAAQADSRRLQAARQFPEAIRSTKRGLALAARTPGIGPLKRSLGEQLRLSRRGGKAQELHELTDLIRFRYGLAPMAPDEMRSLVRRGQLIWEERGLLAPANGRRLDPATERQIETDLLELAVVWADLRMRLASREELAEARRDALSVLGEAEASFGPSPALDRERRRLAAALGPGDAPIPPGPAPRTAWDHYDLGKSYLRSGQFAPAAEEFRRTLELRPQDFWPNFYQGFCAYRLGQFEDAVGAFRACISLAPQAAESYFNRALAYDALGRVGEATLDYSRAIELDARLSGAFLNRGILSYKAGRPLEAIADFHRAMKSSPSREMAGLICYNLALAHLARGDRSSARASAREAIDLGSGDARDLIARL